MKLGYGFQDSLVVVKSHFLKILSYILDSNLIVEDRTPISFFEEKIDDYTIIANMKKSASVSTDVRLF